jgi:hypothetical protein
MSKEQKAQDFERGLELLGYLAENFRSGEARLVIGADYGKGLTDYFRVLAVYKDDAGRIQTANLTWAIAKVLGFSLRDRNGAWFLALNGGGYSKPFEIVRHLAGFYGVEGIRHESL